MPKARSDCRSLGVAIVVIGALLATVPSPLARIPGASRELRVQGEPGRGANGMKVLPPGS